MGTVAWRPARVPIDNITVISGDALIEGTVTGNVLVINGDLVVAGTVEGDINVWRGSLGLASSALIENVWLVRSDLTQSDGATVRG